MRQQQFGNLYREIHFSSSCGCSCVRDGAMQCSGLGLLIYRIDVSTVSNEFFDDGQSERRTPRMIVAVASGEVTSAASP